MIKAFDDVFEDVTRQGTKVKTDEYHSEGAHIIIDQSQEQIAGYTDFENGLFTSVPALVFGDHTRVVKYVDKPFFLGADGVKVLRSKLSDANYRYLYYVLKNIRIPNTGYNRHFKWLKEAKIEYPGNEEQLSTATVLDKLSNIIEARKAELHKFDDLIKARFVEMFGEPIENTKKLPTEALKDVLVLKAGEFTAASDITDKQTDTNKYPCYGGNGVRGYVANYNQEGDYSLIGRQGALSGNVQFATGRFKNTEHALLVTPLVEMDSIWLNQLLVNLDLKRYQTGAAQPGLSVKNLQEIRILMVPIEAQKQYASFVAQVDKSKVTVQKALDETQVLFDSLMQQYFG